MSTDSMEQIRGSGRRWRSEGHLTMVTIPEVTEEFSLFTGSARRQQRCLEKYDAEGFHRSFEASLQEELCSGKDSGTLDCAFNLPSVKTSPLSTATDLCSGIDADNLYGVLRSSSLNTCEPPLSMWNTPAGVHWSETENCGAEDESVELLPEDTKQSKSNQANLSCNRPKHGCSGQRGAPPLLWKPGTTWVRLTLHTRPSEKTGVDVFACVEEERDLCTSSTTLYLHVRRGPDLLARINLANVKILPCRLTQKDQNGQTPQWLESKDVVKLCSTGGSLYLSSALGWRALFPWLCQKAAGTEGRERR